MIKRLFRRKSSSDNDINENELSNIDFSDFKEYAKADFKTFEELLEQTAAFSFEKQLNFGEVIGSNNWQFDMNKGEITFGDNLVFPVQIIGSLSFNDSSWMWGWANSQSGIPDNLLIQSNKLRALGDKLKIDKLTDGHYSVEQGFEHKIGMIACGYFDSDSYYCANYGQGSLVVTIQSDKIPKIEKDNLAGVLSAFPQFISAIEINHKRSFNNYLIDRQLKLDISDEMIRGNRDDKVIIATFDSNDRLIKLDVKI